MQPLDILPLTHSWPLFERDQRFDLGRLFDWDGMAAIDSAWDLEALTHQGIGVWECNLRDNALTWSPGVYDLFGLPRESMACRAEAVALYSEPSRAAMERLRAYAIKHRRGFTLDAEIRAHGRRRWMRLVAAPVCVNGRAVRLQGTKRDVTHDYQ